MMILLFMDLENIDIVSISKKSEIDSSLARTVFLVLIHILWVKVIWCCKHCAVRK